MLDSWIQPVSRGSKVHQPPKLSDFLTDKKYNGGLVA